MGLVRSSLPFNTATRSVPFDAAMSFGLGVSLTASGWVSGAATSFVNLGPPVTSSQSAATPSNVGRVQGTWLLQVASASVASANEFYQFFLYGSNDPAFAAGNADLLGAYDIAATAALRLGDPAGQAAAWPGVGGGSGGGNLGVSSAIYNIPFSNDRDLFTFQFINLFLRDGRHIAEHFRHVLACAVSDRRPEGLTLQPKKRKGR
jgi:hypothetical protein